MSIPETRFPEVAIAGAAADWIRPQAGMALFLSLDALKGRAGRLHGASSPPEPSTHPMLNPNKGRIDDEKLA
jgi:hypothetical protein